eukprot:455253-Amorphochlora_amoeboformis.AAC.1
MAGPMVSCEVFPHVQTHFFAMSPQGLAYLEMMECGGTLAIQRYNREVTRTLTALLPWPWISA